jgi:hypothetical protein
VGARRGDPARDVSLRAQSNVTFENVAKAIGITFTHVNGASADKYLVETMGSGRSVSGLRQRRLDRFARRRWWLDCGRAGQAWLAEARGEGRPPALSQ